MEKKIILMSAICGLVMSNATAQWGQVPNVGFEIWTTNGNYEDPNYWKTLNPQTASVAVQTATKDSINKHSGTYALKLESKNIPLVNVAVSGIATTGTIFMNLSAGITTINGGFPCSVQPDTLIGYYTYAPASAWDTMSVKVYLTKWDTSANVTDTVATGIFMNSAAQGTFTKFYATLNYISSSTPDTANIIILSNDNTNIVVGTVLRVDDIEFVGGNVGIKEITNNNSVTISPNPFSTTATITINSELKIKNAELRMYDLLGREVRKYEIRNMKYEIQREDLQEGMYFYIIRSEDSLIGTGKLIIANN